MKTFLSIIALAVLVFIITLFLPKQKEYEEEKIDNTGGLNITVRLNLGDSVITPPQKEVEKGSCYKIAVNENDVFFRKPPSRFKPKAIKVSNAFAFTIPGREGKWFMSENSTVVCPTEDGKMDFSLDYPSFLNKFAGNIRKTEDGLQRIDLKVVFEKTDQKEESDPPIQFVRFGPPVSMLFPDTSFKNKHEDVHLESSLQKIAEDLNESFEAWKK